MAVEDDYKRLKNMEQVLLSKPDSRRLLEQALDSAGVVVPAIQQERLIESKINARVKELEEEVKQVRRQHLEKEVAEEEASTIRKLKRAPYNLSEDDIKEIKALVVEKNKQGELVSMETAAGFYISRRPVAATSLVRTPYSTRGQRGKWDWRKELRDPKSKLFNKGESLNYLKEQYDKAWDEGLELIESQQPQY